MLLISVGNAPNADELQCIQDLDNDDSGHVFDVGSFDELEQLGHNVIQYLTTPTGTDPVSGNKTYHLCYNLNVPLQKNLTLHNN